MNKLHNLFHITIKWKLIHVFAIITYEFFNVLCSNFPADMKGHGDLT